MANRFLSNDPQTLQREIYLFWYERNKGKTFNLSGIVFDEKVVSDLESETPLAYPESVAKRIENDAEVMAYAEKLRGEDPAGLFYGNLHIRYKNRGFVSGLDPSQYAVVHRIDDEASREAINAGALSEEAQAKPPGRKSRWLISKQEEKISLLSFVPS